MLKKFVINWRIIKLLTLYLFKIFNNYNKAKSIF